MRNVLLIFLDGVGIGEEDFENNPFYKYPFKTFSSIFNNIPNKNNPILINNDKYLFPTDALLGIEGLPQSGTGQTSIFCGVNAQQIVGKHFGPFPYSTLLPVIENDNIFNCLIKKNKKAAFANAFPQIFFDYINEGKRRLSVSSLSCLYSGIPLFTFNDLLNGNALSAEIDNFRWVTKLNYNLPIIEPEKAAQRLLYLTEQNNFVLFEYFYSDHLGHGRLTDNFQNILKTLDDFLYYILSNYNNNTTVIICSDHGNLEDLSIKTHTLNPCLTIAAGKNSDIAFKQIKDISQIKQFICGELC
ncbi:MAG: metalloenzyme [bacterium]